MFFETLFIFLQYLSCHADKTSSPHSTMGPHQDDDFFSRDLAYSHPLDEHRRA